MSAATAQLEAKRRTTGCVKVNLGCGPVWAPDWVNVDHGLLPLISRSPLIHRLLLRTKILSPFYDAVWPRDLVLHDCRRPLPFADESADFIYSSHFIEHLHR